MARLAAPIHPTGSVSLWQEVNWACAVASIDTYADYELRQEAAGESVRGNIAAFRALREEQAARGRQLTLDLSLGGWTKSTYFSGCAKSAEGREAIVSTSLALLDRTGFDGIGQTPHMVHSHTVHLPLGALLT